jgi:hypothetical protein
MRQSGVWLNEKTGMAGVISEVDLVAWMKLHVLFILFVIKEIDKNHLDTPESRRFGGRSNSVFQ